MGVSNSGSEVGADEGDGEGLAGSDANAIGGDATAAGGAATASGDAATAPGGDATASGDGATASGNGWSVVADPDLVCTPDPDASDLQRRLWDAVDEIPDPHIPVSLVEMGMVYGVRVDDGSVTVEMTYPCLGCPAYDMIQNDVRSRLVVETGVDEVGVEVVWDPVWSKDLLTADVRRKIREAGIGI